MIYSSIAFKDSIQNKILLNESFTIRANLLYDAYKFISLKHLLKAGQENGVDENVLKIYQDKYDEVRRKQAVSTEKFNGFLEDLKEKDLSELYLNSKQIIGSISHFAKDHSEEIEQVLLSKNEKDKRYETINELVSYSHLLYLIALVKGFNKKDDAKTFLFEAKNILHPVRDLLETKEELYLYAKINNQISCIQKNKRDEKEAYKKYIKNNGRDIKYSDALAMRYALGMLCGFVIVLCLLSLICIGVAKETFYAYVGADLPTFVTKIGVYSFIGLNFFIWFFIEYCFISVVSNKEKYSYLSKLYKRRCLYLLILSILIETFVFINTSPLINSIITVITNLSYSVAGSIGFVSVVNLIQIAKRKNIEIEDCAFYKDGKVIKKSLLILSFIGLLLAFATSCFLLKDQVQVKRTLDWVIAAIVCLINLSGFVCQIVAYKIGRNK